MKAKIIIIFLALSLMTTLGGCEFESSDNGDLDGMWHLERVDTLGHGSLNYKEKHLYWSFQNNLMQTNNTEKAEFFIYRFSHAGDSLIITEPRISDRDLGDTLLIDISPISKYGINSTRESFYIERLNGSDMVLDNKWLRLVFRKF